MFSLCKKLLSMRFKFSILDNFTSQDFFSKSNEDFIVRYSKVMNNARYLQARVPLIII